MNVLVLNVGSSTVKFQLIRTDQERIQENQDENGTTGRETNTSGSSAGRLEIARPSRLRLTSSSTSSAPPGLSLDSRSR